MTNCKELVPLLYGMGVWVNQPIPALSTIPTTCNVDIQVWFGVLPPDANTTRKYVQPWYYSTERNEYNQPILTIGRIGSNGDYWLQYLNGTEFIVDRLGSQIWASWPITATLEDTLVYFLGPVIGFVLAVRSILCFHASAIAIDGQAIALIGPSGAGKSSTVAAFAHAGYRILTDDIVALTEQDRHFFVQPAHPHIRLWSQTVKSLYGHEDALPWLTPTWDKRCLDVGTLGDRFQTEPLPLAALYILEERRNDPSAPFIEKLPNNEGLMKLVANTYAAKLPNKARRARDFIRVSHLSATLPLRRVIPHTDIAYLPNLCEVIAQDFRSLSSY